jgi:hypothetical protein
MEILKLELFKFIRTVTVKRLRGTGLTRSFRV